MEVGRYKTIGELEQSPSLATTIKLLQLMSDGRHWYAYKARGHMTATSFRRAAKALCALGLAEISSNHTKPTMFRITQRGREFLSLLGVEGNGC